MDFVVEQTLHLQLWGRVADKFPLLERVIPGSYLALLSKWFFYCLVSWWSFKLFIKFILKNLHKIFQFSG